MNICAAPSTTDIAASARKIRAALATRIDPPVVADAISAVMNRWRERDYAPRRETIAAISALRGYSAAMLDESLDALIAPFSRGAMRSIAARAGDCQELCGFVMAGNIAGAGIHEVVIALIAGAGMIIKTSAMEPNFFAAFAQSLTDADRRLGERIAVFNWDRERADLTAAMIESCDVTVAYGDDATIARLTTNDPRIIGFGSLLSAAVVARGAVTQDNQAAIVRAIARDVSLFEQLGCLSPHHVFVECDSPAVAQDFAAALAGAMSELACVLAPARAVTLEDAAALRRARETARWRQIGGEAIQIFEGPAVTWAVIFDRDASVTASPGMRTVSVSPFAGPDDLARRLAPAAGKFEAFVLAAPDETAPAMRRLLSGLGASYIAAPGAIQSPPMDWRHGGGAFLDRMMR